MIFILYVICYICAIADLDESAFVENNAIWTREKVDSQNKNSNNYGDVIFKDLPRDTHLDINLDNYNKVVRDFFSNITEHPDIKKKIDNLLSKNHDIDKSFLLSLFKQYLHEFNFGKVYDTKCSKGLSFFKSLASRSYKLILRLSSILDNEEYIGIRDNIKYQIFNSVDLIMDDKCENKIIQLFNTKKYNKISSLLDKMNIEEHFLREQKASIPFAPWFKLRPKPTTPKPFVNYKNPKVYVHGGVYLSCKNKNCSPSRNMIN
ncbi:putative SP-containing protein [Vairimorpha necatrix]|uniref:SP-containing protein n=1 Tax=Vairimorpha necatrix TaxID=6039 RepID=A0AAX4JAE0_9MICR